MVKTAFSYPLSAAFYPLTAAYYPHFFKALRI